MQIVAKPAVAETQELNGLTAIDIQRRIERGEGNDFEARVGRTYWDIFRDNVLNLFNIVLGSMLILVIMLGDYATAFFAGFSVVSNTFFGMIQEFSLRHSRSRL